MIVWFKWFCMFAILTFVRPNSKASISPSRFVVGGAPITDIGAACVVSSTTPSAIVQQVIHKIYQKYIRSMAKRRITGHYDLDVFAIFHISNDFFNFFFFRFLLTINFTLILLFFFKINL